VVLQCTMVSSTTISVHKMAFLVRIRIKVRNSGVETSSIGAIWRSISLHGLLMALHWAIASCGVYIFECSTYVPYIFYWHVVLFMILQLKLDL
jgi:hypothetical protein